MLLHLSERLLCIAECVDKDDIVADIGTDHGYIPIWLIQNNICKKVIFTDIGYGPLEKARINFRKYIGETEPDIRQGNGLTVLEPKEATCLIIAGMGGTLIKNILSDSPEIALSANKLILQPRRDALLLRRYLSESGKYLIYEEKVAKERNKYSEIIAAVPIGKDISEKYLKRIYFANKLAQESGLPESFFLEFPKAYLCGDNRCEEFINYRLRGANFIKNSIIKNSNKPEAYLKLRKIEERISNIKRFIEVIKEKQ